MRCSSMTGPARCWSAYVPRRCVRASRGEPVQLKVSFSLKKCPCKRFKRIVREGGLFTDCDPRLTRPHLKANSKPLLFDADISKDIDLSLRDILAVHQLLDDLCVTVMQM